MSSPIPQHQPYDPSLRITDCTTLQQAIELIRTTPNERIPLFRLLFDIIDAEERRIFDQWDLLEMRTVLLQKMHDDPNELKHQLLSFVSQQITIPTNHSFSSHEVELIIECLLKI
jgi:hypothetical protein